MNFDTISADFALLDDWEDRYRYVIELGKALPELPEAEPIQAYVGTGPRVVVFGDSLAFGATEQALAALDG